MDEDKSIVPSECTRIDELDNSRNDSDDTQETISVIEQFEASIPSVLERISRIKTAKDARVLIDNVEAAYHYLEARKVFAECANRFCELEARLWVRISKVLKAPYAVDFTKKEMNLVKWLKGKDNAELTRVIHRCATGVRIFSVKNADDRDRSAKKRPAREVEELSRIKKKIVHEGRTLGKTECSRRRFYEEWKLSGKPDTEAVNAYTEEAKNELLKSGVYGLGDDSRIYVNVDNASDKELVDVVANRLRRIVNGMTSVVAICERANIVVSDSTIRLLHEIVDSIRVGAERVGAE
jgi:hypothetical protein